jgi:16S rRNA A1518/A1519 N6-dimethyltransferase RsmA/KsgA/DIM1 with predicted DNA glycosylase/AP lyase activity
MYYDFVYEQTFGSLYHTLATYTLNVINQILPTGTILDFGAGTGRLTIPLLEAGYHVIAVEKSRGMIGELLRKAKEKNLQPNIHPCSISEYENGKADMALALFTVLSYSITEDELSKNIHKFSGDSEAFKTLSTKGDSLWQASTQTCAPSVNIGHQRD